jgi:hypothetical protein
MSNMTWLLYPCPLICSRPKSTHKTELISAILVLLVFTPGLRQTLLLPPPLPCYHLVGPARARLRRWATPRCSPGGRLGTRDHRLSPPSAFFALASRGVSSTRSRPPASVTSTTLHPSSSAPRTCLTPAPRADPPAPSTVPALMPRLSSEWFGRGSSYDADDDIGEET